MEFTKDEVLQILKYCNIPIIDESVNYWFLRTNGGENFEDFYFGDYIAIGWDKINNLEEIKDSTFDYLKDSISELYPDDTKPGSTASQIKRFVCEMKIGDYVLIPGSNCDRIAFGIISGDPYVHQATGQEIIESMFDGIEIDQLKRRNVKWLVNRPFMRAELDPMLIPIIYSYGTIVNANPYASFINRTLYSCYMYKDELHTVYDVTCNDKIPALDLCDFINSIFESLDLYSELYKTQIDKNEISIKATINSPGPVEIITCATSAFIVLSAIALFVNGAKIKFSFDILKIVKGEVDIDSPGLIDKITEHGKISTENQLDIAKTEAKIVESKEKLKLQKKQNKK